MWGPYQRNKPIVSPTVIAKGEMVHARPPVVMDSAVPFMKPPPTVVAVIKDSLIGRKKGKEAINDETKKERKGETKNEKRKNEEQKDDR